MATRPASSVRNALPRSSPPSAAATAADTAAAAVGAANPYSAASGRSAGAPTRDWNAPAAGCPMSCGSGTPGTGR